MRALSLGKPAFAAALGRMAFWVLAAGYVVSVWLGKPGLDCFGQAILPDFTIYYVAGDLVWTGREQLLYDWPTCWSRVQELAAQPDHEGMIYLYPPFTAWLCVPLAWLPFRVTVWTYLALNLALALGLGWWVARWFFRELTLARAAFWLFAGSLPFWHTVLFGQNGTISLLLTWAGWVLYRRDKAFAGGLVWALGAYKPQMFVGVWLWGLLFGSWRLRAGLILGGALMAWANVAVLGLDGIRHWQDTVRVLAEQPDMAFHRFSLLDAACMMGVYGTWPAQALWGLVLAAWLGVLVLAWWRPSAHTWHRPATLAFALMGWLLVVPRISIYDAVVLFPVVAGAWACLRSRPETGRVRVALGITLVLIYFTPAASALGFPLMTLLLAGWTVTLGRGLVRTSLDRNGHDDGTNIAEAVRC